MDSKKIGKYITELRKYYKITQDELASRLGVTRQAVSKWETGVAIPDIELLMQLSDIYGISVNDIVKADISKIKYQKEIVFPEKEKKETQIAVIGCGRWGTFLAWYLERIVHHVTLYGRATSNRMNQLMEMRKNEYVTLSETIELSTDFRVVEEAEIIVVSVS